MKDIIFELIVAIIPVIGIMITNLIINYLKPYLTQKLGVDKLEEYSSWATKAVKAAQQIYTTEQWREKKDYCVSFMVEAFDNALSREQIEILIESAVKELKLLEKSVSTNENSK